MTPNPRAATLARVAEFARILATTPDVTLDNDPQVIAQDILDRWDARAIAAQEAGR